MPISGAIALLAFLPALAAGPTAPRPFSVDDLLRLEQVCQVAFDPSGRILLFERVAAYEDSGNFAQPWPDLGWNRSMIYSVNLDRSSRPHSLFHKAPGQSYWHGTISPKGTKVTVYHRTASGIVGGGIFDFDKNEFLPLGSVPDLRAFFGPDHVWLSETKLVYAARPPGRQPLDTASRPLEVLPEVWQQARDGATVTVSVVASGQLADAYPSSAAGSLVYVDTRNGAESVLTRGAFLELKASPNGRLVAAIERGKSLRPAAGSALSHFALKFHSPLTLFPIGTAGEPISVCANCDAYPGSLKWSEDGDQILFYGRERGEKWTDGRFYRYRISTRAISPLLSDGFKAVRRPEYIAPPARAEWLGGRPLVHARPVDPAGGPARADWYLLDGRATAANLTASFPVPPADLAAVSADALYLVDRGDLWRITADGARRNLTEEINVPLELWRPSQAPGCGDASTLDTSRIVLQADDDAGAPIVLFDLATGVPTLVERPSSEAELLAVAPKRPAAVFLQRPPGGANRLVLVVANGRTVPLLELNSHMSDVALAAYRRISDPNDASADPGWLLLPPDHQPGQSHPLIVHIYPGFVHRSRPRWSPYQPFPLNPHLLAAHGFAVLFPSVPLTPEGGPGDPLIGLAERIMPVIDRAIEEGYADPDRIGLFGHSYGAYGVLGIVSQTDRFKAAVAANGISNLFDNYGGFDIRFRADASDALRLFAASWSESGQGRMGAPPWRDPERYRRNSPLFHAEKITTPVMLVHGDLDYVAMAQSEQMFTALHRMNKDAVFLRYWGEGHVLASPANIRDFWKRVLAWYSRYLGPPDGHAMQHDSNQKPRAQSGPHDRGEERE